MQLCGGPAMGLLRPEELEQLVCGRTELDFAALQDAARYDSGFTADTPVRCPHEALQSPCCCNLRACLPACLPGMQACHWKLTLREASTVS